MERTVHTDWREQYTQIGENSTQIKDNCIHNYRQQYTGRTIHRVERTVHRLERSVDRVERTVHKLERTVHTD